MTAVKPYQSIQNIPNSGTMQSPTQMTGKVISGKEYEFFIEAKNLITDMANDEELGAGYRDQARRLITRLVMDKL